MLGQHVYRVDGPEPGVKVGEQDAEKVVILFKVGLTYVYNCCAIAEKQNHRNPKSR